MVYFLTFIGVPDPRFEEDCQGLQAHELARAHPIGGCWEDDFRFRWCEILNIWDKLMDVSWLGMHSPSVEAFSSLDISASQFVKDFLSQKQFAQYDNDNANWMGMIPSNHFPLPYVLFFFPFLSWVVAPLVSLLPCFWNRKQEACAAEGFGPENNGYWPPYRLLDHSFSSNAGPPKKVSACYWWCVTVGGFGFKNPNACRFVFKKSRVTKTNLSLFVPRMKTWHFSRAF